MIFESIWGENNRSSFKCLWESPNFLSTREGRQGIWISAFRTFNSHFRSGSTSFDFLLQNCNVMLQNFPLFSPFDAIVGGPLPAFSSSASRKAHAPLPSPYPTPLSGPSKIICLCFPLTTPSPQEHKMWATLTWRKKKYFESNSSLVALTSKWNPCRDMISEWYFKC